MNQVKKSWIPLFTFLLMFVPQRRRNMVIFSLEHSCFSRRYNRQKTGISRISRQCTPYDRRQWVLSSIILDCFWKGRKNIITDAFCVRNGSRITSGIINKKTVNEFPAVVMERDAYHLLQTTRVESFCINIKFDVMVEKPATKHIQIS